MFTIPDKSECLYQVKALSFQQSNMLSLRWIDVMYAQQASMAYFSGACWIVLIWFFCKTPTCMTDLSAFLYPKP